jgi:DNA-binding response OmpR family regulator
MDTELLKSLSSYKVLYIEDEDGIRENMTELFEDLFKSVISVDNVPEALKQYKENKPDLIISDIRVKEYNGLDLIKEIRKTDNKTRIIVTSAFTDLDYLLKAAELHLVKYIVKPIDDENLEVALKDFVESMKEQPLISLKDGWIYDKSNLLVKNDNEEFVLTKKEALFLNLLLDENKVIPYQEMEDAIWENSNEKSQNAIRLFVKNMRKKLPEKSLNNVQGVGYRLDLK